MGKKPKVRTIKTDIRCLCQVCLRRTSLEAPCKCRSCTNDTCDHKEQGLCITGSPAD